MDSNLQILEKKVLEAVGLIKELRGENSALQERCDELQGQVEDLSGANRKLKQELEEARQIAGEFEVYEEKRKEIEDRVGGLLQQLEALG
jgi:predicted nuclease with TOPRIM domain